MNFMCRPFGPQMFFVVIYPDLTVGAIATRSFGPPRMFTHRDPT
jgi:hypothetical protein